MIRDQIKVFLNYAKEDVEYARRLNNDLKNESINVWYDENSLLGGQRWKTAIRNAIRDSDYFIALLSSKSVSKKGYVQKELKEAFDCLGEMPESDIFVIPVRIDDCKPSHEKLDEIHWVDIFPDWKVGLRKILNTIKSYNTQLKNIQHIDMQKNEYDSSLVGYQAKIGDKLIRVNRIQYEILSRLEKIHPKPGFYRDFEDFLNEDILVKNRVCPIFYTALNVRIYTARGKALGIGI
ncbi:MAG: toll/interleukin-1 receptor domain-containing protein [Desulfobacteraceae bacterium]|nr:toll/interleukin-1 receptor domain-containing protein [Desulfobacteraceae bacterium]